MRGYIIEVMDRQTGQTNMTTTHLTKHIDTRKTMTAAQIKYFTGKRVDPVKWVIPDFYAVCEMTGKMYRDDSDVWVSFNHWAFEKSALRKAKISSIEDASWLTEEGFFKCLDALHITNNQYADIVWNYAH